MDQQTIEQCGDELFDALRARSTVAPLSGRFSEMTVEDAYQISLRMLHRREAEGERIVGKKIGVTSKAVQNMLNVHQPDFGYLTDRMVVSNGGEIKISESMIQPRAEGEIAFILKRDLIGPGISNADVLRATECVMPCFEIVDSRIENWQIKIQDTVADNASCGTFVLGDTALKPDSVDLITVGMVVEKNGAGSGTEHGAIFLHDHTHSNQVD